MTPRDVDELSHDEFVAFWRYAEQVARDQKREADKARRRR